MLTILLTEIHTRHPEAESRWIQDNGVNLRKRSNIYLGKDAPTRHPERSVGSRKI